MTQSILIYYSSTVETLSTSVDFQSQLIHGDVDWRQNTGYTIITNHCQSSVHLFPTWTGSESRQAHFPIVAGQATCVLFRPDFTPCATAERWQAKNS